MAAAAADDAAAISPAAVGGPQQLMVEAIAEVLNSWQEAAAAVPFNLLPAFNRLTMEVLVGTLLARPSPRQNWLKQPKR